ncbi:hypothetical protein PpBr36_08236 [Pyricularia pennisetigena]|uniref:hypothetical protein n=1 Tax=Pyricularia pennisetigena TaxID=1578925 RepID=UPI00114E38D3|nr:hypothetical protein PpBr36_08236 [Pyricularia pennisetigena]TLS24491.1 hypothetical protein PpBr36_08236 [Pyricularia pennisetigena]
MGPARKKKKNRGQRAAAAVRHSTQPKLGWLMECASRFAPFRRVPSRPLPSISSVAPIPKRWVGWRDRELLNSRPGG